MHFNYIATEINTGNMKSFTHFLVVALLLAGCGNSEQKLIRKADKIQASVLTVDTHCDTPMDFSDPLFDLGVRARGRLC